MARGLNKAILIGNVGNMNELKTFNNDGKVLEISLATSSGYKDKTSGEVTYKTEWHNIVFNNHLASIANSYLSKGASIYVEGSLRTTEWTDKAGIKRKTTKIIATDLNILSKKDDNAVTVDRTTTNERSQLEFEDDLPF
jgi:single-strand DNA-binding protein